jgi:hypothetical protein
MPNENTEVLELSSNHACAIWDAAHVSMEEASISI